MKLRHVTMTVALALSACGDLSCASPQVAENNVMSAEQIGCIAAKLVSEDAGGDTQQIAADIVQACPSVASFSAQIVDIINSFVTNGAAMKLDTTKRSRK